MFELNPLPIAGAFVITGRVLKDNRGDFHKKVHAGFFEQHGLVWSFPEQFYSVSHARVLRGMHFQAPPHDHVKLIYCTRGKATDVLLDLRKNSKTYGQCAEVKLEGGDGRTIYIPKGIAHGFLSNADETTLHYCVSSQHQPEADLGIRWDSISYDWKISSPLISDRDRALPAFTSFQTPFTSGK